MLVKSHNTNPGDNWDLNIGKFEPRSCCDDPDGAFECNCCPEVEEVSADPDEKQGSEDQDYGWDPQWNENP